MIELIQPFLAPAVMISAGALICLSQFARFTAVIGQLRGLQRESLAALREAGDAEPAQREQLLQRAQGLENQ